MVALAVTSCLDRIPWIFILGFIGAWCPSFLSCQKGSERTLKKGRGKRPGPSYSCGAIRSSLRGVIAPPAFGLRGRCGGGVGSGPAARSFPPQGIKIRRRHPIRPTLRRERAISGLSGSKHYPNPLAAAQPSIELPRSTSIMVPRSTPVQADWAAFVGPNLSDRRLWPSGSRAQPWSLFAFFLSTQKEGPRRRGARRDAS